MLYVNTFIEQLHKNCDSFMGYANKNTGDHYIMIWKLEEIESNEDDQHELNVSNTQLAELSLMCFIKVLYDAKNDEAIVKLNT